MKRLRLWLLRAASIATLAFVVSCAPTFSNHGYVPSESELEQVNVGVDSQASVEQAIGRPTSTGVLKDSGWYYMSSRVRNFAYREPQIIDRQVVAISFDKRGVVSNIERFTLEDGRVIALNRRVTKTGIKGVSLIRQLLSNIGRVSLADEF
ncbi:MAG: outer membrane protein assembly factor BamE [Rhodobacteraceae bacterium]|nr:outer membrane protein assembly factor BamE [Paracoccaceae bacterium]